MDEKIIAKLKEAKSVDEMIDLAKANGVELAKGKAQELFDKFNSNGELNDDILDSVAGGIVDKVKDFSNKHL